MAKLYKDTKVWVKVAGGVAGFDLEEISSYITKYNNLHISEFVDFWTFLACELDEVPGTFEGFSALWNDKNPLVSKLPAIRG